MNKIKRLFELYRLDYESIITIIKFYLKKVLHIPYTDREYSIFYFFLHNLTKFNGSLIKQENGVFTSKYILNNKRKNIITLRELPSSDLILFGFIFGNEYQLLIDIILKNKSFKNEQSLTVIDAGANIGLTTLFINNYFPNSKYILIEPDNENFELLIKNVNQNNIRLLGAIRGGIWNKNIYLNTTRGFRDKKDWSIQVIESELPTGITGVTISKIIDTYNLNSIDIFKVDIEGAERQLFYDSESSKKFLSITKYLAIEIHKECKCEDDITLYLIENNFEILKTDSITIGINRNFINNFNTDN